MAELVAKKMAASANGTSSKAASLHLLIRRQEGDTNLITRSEIGESLDELKKQLDVGATAGRIRLGDTRIEWRLDGELED